VQQRPDEVRKVIQQNIVEAIQEKKSSGNEGMIKVAEITEDNLIYNKIELEGDLGYMYLIGTKK
jgi:hypothetical protein